MPKQGQALVTLPISRFLPGGGKGALQAISINPQERCSCLLQIPPLAIPERAFSGPLRRQGSVLFKHANRHRAGCNIQYERMHAADILNGLLPRLALGQCALVGFAFQSRL